MNIERMRAPEGMVSAEIEGNSIEIPKNRIIKVTNQAHVETLRRHGFTDHFEDDRDWASWIDEQTEEEALVEFIEERGGEADTDMTVKKLRKLAHGVLKG